jgi:hypothetical protein
VVARVAAACAVAGLLFAGCSHSGGTSGQSVFKIKIGDCVVPPTDIKAEITSVKVVPCSKPHTQEVFADVTYAATGRNVTTTTSDVFPGTAVLRTFADGACLQQFSAYVGVDYRDSTLFYTYMLPSARSWSSKAADRTVVCIVTTTGQPLTVSVKGSRL